MTSFVLTRNKSKISKHFFATNLVFLLNPVNSGLASEALLTFLWVLVSGVELDLAEIDFCGDEDDVGFSSGLFALF